MTFRITGRSHRSAASACLSLAVLATIAVPAGAAADTPEPVNVVAVVESGDGLEVIEFASTDPEGLVDLLDGVDTVVAVEPDGEWMPTQGTDTYRHLQTNLTQINAQPGRSAGGVIVAVLDSGVAAHADLPAMAPGYNAVDNNTNLTPTTDHGTNVAGSHHGHHGQRHRPGRRGRGHHDHAGHRVRRHQLLLRRRRRGHRVGHRQRRGGDQPLARRRVLVGRRGGCCRTRRRTTW